MNPALQDAVAFPRTGEKRGGGSEDAGRRDLRPALLARYRNLSALRYDYPLVLVDGASEADAVRSLAGVVNAVLAEIAPRGTAGERLRADVLALELEIRRLVAGGARGSLRRLWAVAEKNLAARTNEPPGDGPGRARAALALDGELVGCDGDATSRVLAHVWSAVEARKARTFLCRVDRLARGLADILKADFMRSAAAREPDRLRRSVGAAYEAAFDFERLSRTLARAMPADPLPEGRCKRIRWALAALESQRFFPGERDAPARAGRALPHAFVFDGCRPALQAYRERMPEMVDLVKALTIAELEIGNRYKEARHDSFFARFDESALAPESLAPFPSYLVRVRDEGWDAAEQATLFELLSLGLPVKVLVQTDDLLGDSSVWNGGVGFGVRGLPLAGMAMGLNRVYVVQTCASNLYQLSAPLATGMAFAGPALFSVFSGAGGAAQGLAPYLLAAAAMQSRAFPAFTFDPGAGADWASRFRIDDNPQADADWPVERFEYADEHLQRTAAEVAFTFVDFVACDRRFARHFALVPRAKWHPGMVPAADRLRRANGEADGVPYILMADANDVLHRAIVDDGLIRAARRCAETWASLQELGGIHNSHVRQALERERKALAEARARAPEASTPRPQPEPRAEPPPVAGDGKQAPAAPAPPAAETKAERPADEPYVETPRCTTCDECIQINPRLFAYDANKQAYIADLGAGTYRDLVEAAESCQVSIIHPGKPRNPDEPGLDELIERAESFR